MDPNEALRRVKRLLELYRTEGGTAMDGEDADEFFDAVEALDDWMSHGGFLPSGWAEGRKAEGR